MINGQKEEKIFINIVSSDKIAKPIKQTVKDGTNWSVPYSLGPPHMEKDKTGANAPAFDCAFHPDALSLSKGYTQFRDLLVHSAMEGIEAGYRKQSLEVKLNKEYHVVKGIQYKAGQVPAMMIDSSSKNKWDKSTRKGDDGGPATEEPPEVADAAAALAEAIATEGRAKEATERAKGGKVAKPAMKKGFLNKDKSPIQSKDKPRPLVEEISSSGKTSSSSTFKGDDKGIELDKLVDSSVDSSPDAADSMDMKAGKTVFKKRPQATVPPRGDPSPATDPCGDTGEAPAETTDSKVPHYAVVERGNVSMGDFESMGRRSVASNRPAELVYKIDIPKVVKPSEVLLDVMPRSLKLTYKDIYFLQITLPYEVNDKKGRAKYDKSAKVLTVTLPVLPPTYEEARAAQLREAEVQMDTSAVTEEKSAGSDIATSGSSGGQQAAAKKEIPAVRQVASKKVTLKHSEQPDRNPYLAAVDDEEKKKADALKEEIAAAAEAAKHKAEEDIKAGRVPNAAHASPISPPKSTENAPVDDMPPLAPAVEIEPGTAYHASPTWRGVVPGYAFKRGPDGQGYYLDTPPTSERSVKKRDDAEAADGDKSESSANTTTSTSDPAKAAVLPAPFEFRQTQVAFAVLIQVPEIVKASTTMRFTEAGFDVSFKSGDQTYASGFDVSGGKLNVDKCRFDVASQNMVVVLTKGPAHEGIWRETLPAEAVLTRRNYKSASVAPGQQKGLDAAEINEKLKEMSFSATSAMGELD